MDSLAGAWACVSTADSRSSKATKFTVRMREGLRVDVLLVI